MANHEQEPDFDPASPDLADPQIAPPHPAKAPPGNQDVDADKRVPDEQYPPYETDE